MAAKTTVAVMFGGCSPEHDVSWESAAYVVAGLDRERHALVLIGIDRQGIWHLVNEEVLGVADQARDEQLRQGQHVMLAPGGGGRLIYPDWTAAHRDLPRQVDMVFPVLHGPGGEDGTLQGLLEQAAVAYVGNGVTASAACMDKAVCRRLLHEAGLPVLPALTLAAGQRLSYAQACLQLETSILMVKPVGQGSSVGISKVEQASEFQAALESARSYGPRVMIEPALARPRELEIGMLERSDGHRQWSAVAEIELAPAYRFYSYQAKYMDAEAISLRLPAELAEDVAARIRDLADRACQVLACEGLARVDFLLSPAAGGMIYINEINTMPGLTRHSLFPALWRRQGCIDRQVIAMLLAHAERRHAAGADGTDRMAGYIPEAAGCG
ncbi:D-alanine--D-alanine ligase family protein [Frateuria aurantia]|uniref:D-alanine--D-alanine ligase n=1 Tax=Frateuria aurantia (strain ATCC 33424 / DSM 6220 / KCTC 2777 / LMG 1558 / NBRC 3245 / NCIMB 13370) TaxID=767434 RepID=H8L038_FRAAD|nr:D-alanine--D-alanine ligase family protein [Frateuria aurantia]AFC86250.1 D-alanine--D-alanine ligase [Frateuria aurantia DSM 6220]